MDNDTLLDQGIDLFNRGQYFEAHEIWEDLWRILDPPRKGFVQGLVHAAVGLYHLNRHNPKGGRAQLTKSVHRLGVFGPDQEIDSPDLIRQLKEVLRGSAPGDVRIRRR